MLGYELCGTYVRSTAHPNGFENRPPLASVAKLKSHLDAHAGQSGVKLARRALKYVLPNSASPRETAIAMTITLPHLLGGFHLTGAHLNYRIPLGQRARQMAEKRYYVCDLYFPEQKLAVEYDSDAFHTASERIANDSKRRNALSYMGITVVTITRRQANSFFELNKVARILAHHLNKRMRPRTEGFVAKQYELRAIAFGEPPYDLQALERKLDKNCGKSASWEHF